MPISEVVHVTLSALDAAPAQASFDKVLFAAFHTVGPEMIRDYTDKTSLATDFAAVPSVLAAADAFFAQNPHPVTFSIGRLTTARQKIFTVDVATPANSTEYVIRVQGQEASYTSDASATVKEIVEGLKAAIDALAISGVSTSENDVTLTITGTAGTWYSIGIDRPDLMQVNETTTSTGLDTELTAILNERDDCYGVTCEHQSESVGNTVASWVASYRKIYGVFSHENTIRTSSTTDLASDLKNASNNRAFVRWSATASEDFPEVGWMASQFPFNPGSRTWNYKSVANATATPVTGNDITNLASKNSGVIRSLGGLIITFGSKMAGGRYIDVQHGMDWLQARCEERMFGLLARNAKIPYTDAGLAMIEGEIRSLLQEAIRNGFLADDANLTVEILPVAQQATNDRAARIVRGVKFRGRLAGAVEEMFIEGTIFP